MINSLKMTVKVVAAFMALSAGLVSTTLVQAGTIVQCGAALCTSGFELTFNGNVGGTGQLVYDSVTGDIALNTAADSLTGNASVANGNITWTMGDGSKIMVNSLSGNADPILGFGLGASTAGSASTFGFTFNLPIALSGQINANSSVSYSLSSLSSAGAQITANGNIVTASEVDTSIGGLGFLNKGVDVGNTFGFSGGPQTQTSSVFTASNTFTGDLAYDLMEVKVDFALSADSSVGISGFVQQTVVPVPAAVWLFGSGLIGLVGMARRKKP